MAGNPLGLFNLKEKIMKALTYLFILIATFGLTVMFSGCEREGPAEKAGEQMDQAVEETEDAMEDAMDHQGPMEKVGENIDETMEETREKVEESME